MLASILEEMGTSVSVTLNEFIVCAAASLIFGLVISLVYMYKNTYTKSIAISLVLLPMIVQLVIMMINGSIGIGIAVAGAFSLIRFRSVPGSARGYKQHLHRNGRRASDRIGLYLGGSGFHCHRIDYIDFAGSI